MSWYKGKHLGFAIEWSTVYAEKNRLTHIYLSNDLFTIRISKRKVFCFWFHLPVKHLSRCYITIN